MILHTKKLIKTDVDGTYYWLPISDNKGINKQLNEIAKINNANLIDVVDALLLGQIVPDGLHGTLIIERQDSPPQNVVELECEGQDDESKYYTVLVDGECESNVRRYLPHLEAPVTPMTDEQYVINTFIARLEADYRSQQNEDKRRALIDDPTKLKIYS